MLQYMNHKMCYLILLGLMFLGVNRETGLVYPSGSPEYACVFNGVRVVQSLVLLLCFVNYCLSFRLYSFGNSNVCSSVSYTMLYLWIPSGLTPKQKQEANKATNMQTEIMLILQTRVSI